MLNDKKYPLFSPKLMQENTFAYVNLDYQPSLQEERTAGVVGCAIEEAVKADLTYYDPQYFYITGLDRKYYSNVLLDQFDKCLDTERPKYRNKVKWYPFVSPKIVDLTSLNCYCMVDYIIGNGEHISEYVVITNRTNEGLSFVNTEYKEIRDISCYEESNRIASEIEKDPSKKVVEKGFDHVLINKRIIYPPTHYIKYVEPQANGKVFSVRYTDQVIKEINRACGIYYTSQQPHVLAKRK